MVVRLRACCAGDGRVAKSSVPEGGIVTLMGSTIEWEQINRMRFRADTTRLPIAMIVLCAVSVVVLGPVIVPMAGGLWSGREAFEIRSMRVLGVTVGVAVMIGFLATMLAWFPACVMAGGRGRWSGLLLVPVLMPPYLAYSGYGLVRDPSWMVGDMLTRLAVSGHTWVTIGVGRGLAIVGLAMWAWPIAALMLRPSLVRVGAAVDDAMRLEAGGLRRAREKLRMHAAGVAGATGAVSLVMLGSALPLHLAQVETLAIDLWRRLSEAASVDWDKIWVGAWPLFGAALVGGAAIALWVGMQHRDHREDDPTPARVSRVAKVLAVVVWGASVLVPLGLFAASIRHWSSIGRFWMLSGEAVGHGAIVAAIDAGAAVLIGGAMACAIGTGRGVWARRWVIAVLSVWIVAALVPGVLIGSALARVGVGHGIAGDVLVVIGHLVRFGCVAALAGCVVGWSEPRDRRDLRWLDGAAGVRGWWLASLPWQLPVLNGAAAVVGLMGFHEIEATMMVQSPGRGNLAQQILGYLHFSRLEELSAAAAWLIGGGLVLSGVASVAIWGSRRGI